MNNSTMYVISQFVKLWVHELFGCLRDKVFEKFGNCTFLYHPSFFLALAPLVHNATEFPQVVQVCQVAAKVMVVPNYAECSPIAPISPISWHWCHLWNPIDHTKWWMVYSKNKHRIWAQYTSTGCSCDHYHTKAAALGIENDSATSWHQELQACKNSKSK